MKIRIRFQDTVAVADAIREAALRATARQDQENVAVYRARVTEMCQAIREALGAWLSGQGSLTVQFDLIAGTATVVSQVPPAVADSSSLEEQTEKLPEKVADMTSRGKF